MYSYYLWYGNRPHYKTFSVYCINTAIYSMNISPMTKSTKLLSKTALKNCLELSINFFYYVCASK